MKRERKYYSPTLLAASQTSEQARPALEWLDVNVLITEVVGHVSPSPNHTIHMRLAPILPVLQADPRQFRQLITLFLENTFRCTPNGGDVYVVSRMEKRMVHIYVQSRNKEVKGSAFYVSLPFATPHPTCPYLS